MAHKSLQRLPTYSGVIQGVADANAAVEEFGGHLGSTTVRVPNSQRLLQLVHGHAMPTGSFKFLGAAAVVADAVRSGDQQLVTASSGNFGTALAVLAEKRGLQLTVVVPSSCPPVKAAAIESSGAVLVRHNGTFESSALYADALAKEKRARFISPDGDPMVMAGAGLLSVNVLGWATDVEAQMVEIYSPFVGGGSCVGMQLGEAVLRVEAAQAQTQIPGVLYFNVNYDPTAKDIRLGTLARRFIHEANKDPSILDVFAGDVEDGSPAWAHLNSGRSIDAMSSLVTELEIECAMWTLHRNWGMRVEASGAAAFAAAFGRTYGATRLSAGAAILSGGNIDNDLFDAVIERGDARFAQGLYPPEFGEAAEWAPAPASKGLPTRGISGRTYIDR